MSNNIVVSHYFGGCPHCGNNDGYLNAGKTHVFFCNEHKTSWIVGFNIFSSWQTETEAEQREKFRRIEDYADVEPLPEGMWSTDPKKRKMELEEHERRVWSEDSVVSMRAAAADRAELDNDFTF